MFPLEALDVLAFGGRFEPLQGGIFTLAFSVLEPVEWISGEKNRGSCSTQCSCIQSLFVLLTS